jgi:thiamine pyrophosphokinase
MGDLFGNDAWLTLVLGAAFVATFLVAVLLLSTRTKGQQRRSLAGLMGRGKKDAASETSWIPAGMAQAGERLAAAGGFGGRLEAMLEQAELPMKAGEFAAFTVLCALAGGVLGALLLTNIIFVLLVAAGLLMQTLQNLRNADVGFNTQNLVLFRMIPGDAEELLLQGILRFPESKSKP